MSPYFDVVKADIEKLQLGHGTRLEERVRERGHFTVAHVHTDQGSHSEHRVKGHRGHLIVVVDEQRPQTPKRLERTVADGGYVVVAQTEIPVIHLI